MKVPTDRRYSETHEWFLQDDKIVTIGITQFAADELTDITYVDLPEVGRKVAVGDAVSEVESVKATSEIFTAVPGVIVEANATLADRPEMINDDAFDEGWIAKIKVDSTDALGSLMTAKEYAAFLRG